MSCESETHSKMNAVVDVADVVLSCFHFGPRWLAIARKSKLLIDISTSVPIEFKVIALRFQEKNTFHLTPSEWIRDKIFLKN